MKNIIEKAKKIRLVIFDVDGVLTSGKLFYSPNGIALKDFHVHDGQGMKYLRQTGVEIGIITACKTTMIADRMRDLGIEHVYQGQPMKIAAFQHLKQKLKLTNEQIAYVGDDLPDLPIIKQVGLGITVANAPQFMRDHALFTTSAIGGAGAAREVCDLIMTAQGTFDEIVNAYLKEAEPA